MNVISKELVILSYRQTVGEKGQVRGKKEKKKKKGREKKKKRSCAIMF